MRSKSLKNVYRLKNDTFRYLEPPIYHFPGPALTPEAKPGKHTSSLHSLTRTDLGTYSKIFRLKNYLLGRANSLEQYWARHIKPFDESVITQECNRLRFYALRLDIYSVVYHTRYKRVYNLSKTFPKSLKEHITQLWGSYYDSPKIDYSKETVANLLYKQLELKSKHGRKAEALARLSLEMQTRKDWYAVFNTLTVESASLDYVFKPGSGAWHNYIVSIDRLFGINSHGSWRKALTERKKGNEFHTYFAVVERGSKTGRLHIHVLHLFKDMPKTFSDPNTALTVPYRREIFKLKPYWSYGKSSPIAVRFGPGDAFAKSGWRWPTAKDRINPLKLSTHGAMVNYIAKYVSKSYIEENKSCQTIRIPKMFRIRCSRNLGKTVVNQLVQGFTYLQVQSIIRERRLPYLPGVRLPRNLLRRSCVKRYLSRIENYAIKTVFNFHMELKSRTKYVKHLMNMMRQTPTLKSPSSGHLMTRNLRNVVVYERAIKKIRDYFESSQVTISNLAGPLVKLAGGSARIC